MRSAPCRLGCSGWHARTDKAADLTRVELAETLVEVTAGLPIYRTYVRTLHVSGQDRSYLDAAVATAERRTPPELGPALAFVRRVPTLDRFPVADALAILPAALLARTSER